VSYLVDADILADYLGGRPDIGLLMTTLLTEGVAISAITYLEILEGIRGGRDAKRRERYFRRFLKQARVLALGRPVAERAVAIRLHLRREKRQIDERALDILVAATAIEHKLTLVTRNTRHYADIPGLRLHGAT
jgi:predicted nucleic acid-binding protein